MVLKTALIIGAGQMGSGIAQVLSTAGLEAMIYDKDKAQLDKAKAGITSSLSKLVEKGKVTEENKNATLAKLSYADQLPTKISQDLVVEAIIENMDIKKSLFSNLSSISREDTILATNTSSLSVTQIAGVVKNPERVIGMHFMNPVPLMSLVEIIRALQTSDATYNKIVELTKALGKTPITALKDYPGFIVNRILVPMLNEAFYVLMEGIATPEDIDEAMRLGTNQPMGPLKLADFVGLDTCLFICECFHRELGEDKYRPCPLLRKYVEAGWLGKKSGRGVYVY
jgi:3-hydroxybutyryl-CoA dehydrogenase